MSIQQLLEVETNLSLQGNKSDEGRNQQFEGP